MTRFLSFYIIAVIISFWSCSSEKEEATVEEIYKYEKPVYEATYDQQGKLTSFTETAYDASGRKTGMYSEDYSSGNSSRQYDFVYQGLKCTFTCERRYTLSTGETETSSGTVTRIFLDDDYDRIVYEKDENNNRELENTYDEKGRLIRSATDNILDYNYEYSGKVCTHKRRYQGLDSGGRWGEYYELITIIYHDGNLSKISKKIREIVFVDHETGEVTEMDTRTHEYDYDQYGRVSGNHFYSDGVLFTSDTEYIYQGLEVRYKSYNYNPPTTYSSHVIRYLE